MGKDGPVTGKYTGNRRFTGQCQFDQTITGIIGVPGTGKIIYVDKNKTSGTTGDGTSWLQAFLTVTEGLADMEDYDVLIIAPGNYDEAAKMEIADVKGCKIFGYGTGMQWGEGSTCIRNVVATTSDILDITGCQALEIAGINFVQVAAYDAINFTGLNYSVHIHDCGFIGNPGTAIGLYGINAAGSNAPDLYVHDCRFFGWKTVALVMGHQRNVIQNNYFVVPNSGQGITFSGNTTSSFNLISDNYFLGGGTSDHGIHWAASTAGNFLIARNIFANFASGKEIYDDGQGGSDENVVENLADSTAGAVEQVDPEA